MVPRYICVIEALLRIPCINVVSLEGYCSMVNFVIWLQLVISGHFICSPRCGESASSWSRGVS